MVDVCGSCARITRVVGTTGDGGGILDAPARHGFDTGTLDFLFLDHDKAACPGDSSSILDRGRPHSGSIVVADDILIPGAPKDRAYMRRRQDGPPAVICVRLLVGAVFLSEGIQKFLYPNQLGPGRFTKIGIPAATFFADLDGVVEIVCGTVIIVGLVTRLAAIPLLIDITVRRGGNVARLYGWATLRPTSAREVTKARAAGGANLWH